MNVFRLSLVSLFITMMMACLGFTARADAPAPPQVTTFYPGQYDDKPATFNFDIKAYVYFTTGSKVKQAKAKVTQNDQMLGYCVFNSTSANVNNVVMVDTKNDGVISNISSGEFALEVIEVTYLVDGQEYTFTDEQNPLGVAHYVRPLHDGVVVDEYGLDGGIFYSYFPKDTEEGTYTFVFDKPISPEGIDTYLEYGQGTQYFVIGVPHTLSPDGLKLTLDFRTARYGVDDMAPGVTFVDDGGNPVPPPTNISFNVGGLTCLDGTRVAYDAYSLDGQFHTVIRGSIYKAYDYVDLSFPTPVLTNVQFFAQANPSYKFNSITADTDMMLISLIGGEYIESADVIISVGSVSARIPDAEIIKGNNTYTVALPSSIKEAGSDGLVVRLDNVVFTKYDGGEHIIKPYGTDASTKEVLSLADLKKLDPNSHVVINVVDGLKVTMSNDYGYVFVEDENDGIMVMTPDYKPVFTEGSLVLGRIVGTYLGYGSFMIDNDASSYVEQDTDITTGVMVDNLDDLLSGNYNYRLVTLLASDALPINVQGNNIIVGSSVAVMTDFIPNFMAPDDPVENVTGVYYFDSSANQTYILLRTFADINRHFDPVEPEPIVVPSIAALAEVEADVDVVLNLVDAKVTYVNEDGLSIIEDATGAIMMMTEDLEPVAEMGKAITGTILGQKWNDETFVLLSGEFTLADADVSLGTAFSLDDAVKPENALRLATFENTEQCPILVDEWSIYIGESIVALDYFDVLPWTFVMPETVDQITGILIPPVEVMDDFDAPAPQMVVLAYRGNDDIVWRPSGITSISAQGNASSDVYDLHGVKVRNAGDDLNSLHRGIYIIDSQKVIIK